MVESTVFHVHEATAGIVAPWRGPWMRAVDLEAILLPAGFPFVIGGPIKVLEEFLVIVHRYLPLSVRVALLRFLSKRVGTSVVAVFSEGCK